MVRLTLLSQIRLLFQLFQQLTSSILVVDGDLRVVGLSMRIHQAQQSFQNKGLYLLEGFLLFLFFFYRLRWSLLLYLFSLDVFVLGILYNSPFLLVRFKLSILILGEPSIDFGGDMRGVFFTEDLLVFTFDKYPMVLHKEGIFNLVVTLRIYFHILRQILIFNLRLSLLTLLVLALLLHLHLSQSYIDLILYLVGILENRMPPSSLFVVIVVSLYAVDGQVGQAFESCLLYLAQL